MSQLEVNPPELRNLGTRVGQQGDTLTRAVADSGSQLVPAGAKGSPWALLAQADRTATGWSDYLRGLAKRVNETGRSLVEAASLYAASDERAAGRLGPR
ncbi:type VII secretion target [Micromonospora sp. WMMD1102]|uniref:type VII secretion target n=1 Tax=Micromonospora sp. WMMD1102 TaxID=3016105 RepID=UPI0024157375|nr:type VII secretion target [Micromonospora sp. WMMD1102]MDG4785454.1 type VII secretion target [Micromonospora sp. WMMD1102]